MSLIDKRVQNDDIARLEQAAQLNERSGQYTRRWEHTDSLLQTVLPFIWIMRDLATGQWSNVYRSNYGPMIQFYNDTVGFILGEQRTVSVHVWDDVVRDAIDRGKFEPTRRIAGNIGTQILNNYTTEVDTNNAVTTQQRPRIRKELLNYNYADLAQMWISRHKGIDDMVASIALLAQVYLIYGKPE